MANYSPLTPGKPIMGVEAPKRKKRKTHRSHLSQVPLHIREPCESMMNEHESYQHVKSENALRVTHGDPIEGEVWECLATLGKSHGWKPEGEMRPFIKIEGMCAAWDITPQSALEEANYPYHVMVPRGCRRMLEKMFDRVEGKVNIVFRKLCRDIIWDSRAQDSGDFRTAYEVVGGSLRGILNAVEQAGYPPPVGHPWGAWHVSM